MMAERSDLILLMFDAHKLDPSDELKDVIQSLRPHPAADPYVVISNVRRFSVVSV
jgi:hypothetical protein